MLYVIYVYMLYVTICFMLQFTSIQSRRRGQGRRREDWPTVIKKEQGFALNIGNANVNVIKGKNIT